MDHARTGPHAAAHLFVIALIAAGALSTIPHGDASAQSGPALRIDPDPTGNRRDSPGELNECRAVGVGEEFKVDLIIEDAEALVAFQIPIDFNGALLKITDREIQTMFLAANEGSNVIDLSSRLPSPPPYTVSGVEIGDPGTADSGSGVLARLTLRAESAGTATLEFARRDFNADGGFDLGPYLKNEDAEAIGDEDDDTYFDGEMSGARIEIGGECPDEVATPEDSSSSANWLIVALGGAGVLVAVALTVILLISRKSTKSA
ncbi:MAG: cohesin domain-containing protein [Dehalococcoidia bacterium]